MCHIFKREIQDQGRLLLSEAGSQDVAPFQCLKQERQETLQEVQTLMHFLGYYHKLMRDHSHIAKALCDLFLCLCIRPFLLFRVQHQQSEKYRFTR